MYKKNKRINEYRELLNEFIIVDENKKNKVLPSAINLFEEMQFKRPSKEKVRKSIKELFSSVPGGNDIAYKAEKGEHLRISMPGVDVLKFLAHAAEKNNANASVSLSDVEHSGTYTTYRLDNLLLNIDGIPQDIGPIYIVDASKGAGGRIKSGSTAQNNVLTKFKALLEDNGLVVTAATANEEGQQSTDVVVKYESKDDKEQTLNIEVKNNNKQGKEINFFDKTHVDRKIKKATNAPDSYAPADQLIVDLFGGDIRSLSDIPDVEFSKPIAGTNKMSSGYIPKTATFEISNLIKVLREHWTHGRDDLFAINTPTHVYVWSTGATELKIASPSVSISFPPFSIESIVPGSTRLKTYGGFRPGNNDRVRAQVVASVDLATGFPLPKASTPTTGDLKETRDLLHELFSFGRSAAALPQQEADEPPQDAGKFVADALAPLDLPSTLKSTFSKHIDKARDEVLIWLDNHDDFLKLAKARDTHAIKEKILPIFKTRQKRIDALTLKEPKSGTPVRPNDPTLKQARMPDEPIKSLLKIIDNRIIKRISTPKATITSQLPADAQIAIVTTTLVAIANMPEDVEEE